MLKRACVFEGGSNPPAVTTVLADSARPRDHAAGLRCGVRCPEGPLGVGTRRVTGWRVPGRQDSCLPLWKPTLERQAGEGKGAAGGSLPGPARLRRQLAK